MAVNTRKTRTGPRRGAFLVRLAFLLLVLFVVIVPFTSVPERFTKLGTEWLQAFRGRDPRPAPPQKENPAKPAPAPVKQPTQTAPKVAKPAVTPKPAPKPVVRIAPKPIPLPPRLPEKVDIDPVSDVREMARGLQLKTGINYTQGGLASKLRTEDSNYQADLQLNITVPTPAKTLAEVELSQPNLGKILPEAESLFSSVKVSPFFFQLFKNKQTRLKNELTKLGKLTTRHNFYDCLTILELKHPKTKRKALWVQADMDVVSDGSDGDRLATMPEEIVNSTHYQPFTSYGWKKTSSTENPMIPGWKQRIKNADAEIKNPSTTAERRKWLIDRKAYLRRGIADMESRSFLIAEYDPFVVMPINMLTYRGTTLAPKVGDYVVVIHDNKLYPAIVGDAGPSFKAGEASLRLARQISPNSSPYARPVSDLSVSYLVFPGSADKTKSAPDYELWRKKCQKLVDDLGGLGENYQLHQWTDLLKPEPEPDTEASQEAPDEDTSEE